MIAELAVVGRGCRALERNDVVAGRGDIVTGIDYWGLVSFDTNRYRIRATGTGAVGDGELENQRPRSTRRGKLRVWQNRPVAASRWRRRFAAIDS